jgi:hypothetical protein
MKRFLEPIRWLPNAVRARIIDVTGGFGSWPNTIFAKPE